MAYTDPFGVGDEDVVASPKPVKKASKAKAGQFQDVDANTTQDKPPTESSDDFGAGTAVTKGGRGAVTSGGGSFGQS